MADVEARAFRPLDVGALQDGRDALGAALRRWQAAWGIDDDAEVQAHAAHEAAPWPPAMSWWRTPAADAWVGVDAAFDAALAGRLFASASTGTSAIAAIVAADAKRDLLPAICEALRCAGPFTPASEPPAQSRGRGSGSIALQARIGTQALHVIRDPLPPPPRAAAAAASPCVPAQEALRHCEVRLLVTVGRLQVRLESLASIAVGDVLRLEQRLDEPALVSVEDGTPLCDGYLGSLGTHRALSLARSGRRPPAAA